VVAKRPRLVRRRSRRLLRALRLVVRRRRIVSAGGTSRRADADQFSPHDDRVAMVVATATDMLALVTFPRVLIHV
jgi:hypothetical protein